MEYVRLAATEVLSPVTPSIIFAIMAGFCGRFHSAALEPASNLLKVLSCCFVSPEELRSCLSQALNDDDFFLGSKARDVIIHALSTLRRLFSLLETAEGDLVSRLMTDIWELHQCENPRALDGSDAVAKFCKVYG